MYCSTSSTAVTAVANSPSLAAGASACACAAAAADATKAASSSMNCVTRTIVPEECLQQQQGQSKAAAAAATDLHMKNSGRSTRVNQAVLVLLLLTDSYHQAMLHLAEDAGAAYCLLINQVDYLRI